MTCDICGSTLPREAVFCPHCGAAVPGAEECQSYIYEAFISYRHLPNDQKQAKRLQRSIEGFRIPRALRKPDGPTRLGKLFRDEDELPTSGSLPDQIFDALQHARFLIVICSRQTSESTWVQQEVEQFAALHGRDRVRLALIEGEPSESFPPLLLSRLEVDESGEVHEVAAEPLAADLRSGGRRRFNTERLRLIAPMLGCGFDDLHQRMRARRLRVAATAASVVAAVSMGFGSFSLYQQRQIEANLRQSRIRESQLLAERSEELAERGDRYQAIQVALAALPQSSTSGDRPFVPAAQVALERALDVYPRSSSWTGQYATTDVWSGEPVLAHRADGLMAHVDAGRQVKVTRLNTDNEVAHFDAEAALGVTPNLRTDPVRGMWFAGNNLICLTQQAVGCFDPETGELLWSRSTDDGAAYTQLAVSGDGGLLALLTNVVAGTEDVPAHRRVELVSSSDGALSQQYDLPYEFELGSGERLAFNDEMTHLAVAADGACTTIDLAEGSILSARLNVEEGVLNGVASIAWAGTRVAVVTTMINPNDSYGAIRRLEVFNANMYQLWERTDSHAGTFNEQGIRQPIRSGVYGVVEATDEGQRDMLVVLADSLLLELDADTGEEVMRIRHDAPFVTAAVFGQPGNRTIAACLADGEVILRRARGASREDYTGFFSYEVEPCTSAEFVRCDSGIYLVSLSAAPNTLRVTRYCAEDGWPGTQIDELSACTHVRGWNTNGETLLVGTSENGVVVADAAEGTITARFEANDFADLNLGNTLEWGVAPSVSGETLFVYGYRRPAKGKSAYTTVVYEMSLQTGEQVRKLVLDNLQVLVPSSYELHDQLPVRELVDAQGARSLLVASGHECRVVELEDGGDERTLWTTETLMTGVYLAGGCLVGMPYEGEGGLVTIDMATGEQVSSELEAYRPLGMDGSMVAVSADAPYLAMLCDDGDLRLFDVAAGSLLWESSEVHWALDYLAVLPDSGDVLVQDQTGMLTLLAHEDGAVRATSFASLAPIETAWQLDDPNLLAARCEASRSMVMTYKSAAVINLDPEAFGPQSVVDQGIWLSDDQQHAVTRKVGSTYLYYAMPHYTLDELMAHAHDQVVGHELTEAERSLYHVSR